jgi:hypothetical protein
MDWAPVTGRLARKTTDPRFTARPRCGNRHPELQTAPTARSGFPIVKPVSLWGQLAITDVWRGNSTGSTESHGNITTGDVDAG